MENEKNNLETTPESPPEERKFRFGCLHVAGIVAAVVVITAIATAWWVKHYIYASPFTPTHLTAQEQKVLETKLSRLEAASNKSVILPKEKQRDEYAKDGSIKPEAYSEEGAKREINFTEKELNSLIANEPDVAQKVAIDLSDDLVSVKIIAPMDEGLLLVGGKTLRINMGAILSYENNQPVVALKGVTLGGVPLPNAWLGNLKNKNLVEEFGSDGGFWKLFADGVNDIKVKDGHILVSLKE